jgi:hypothetical protein
MIRRVWAKLPSTPRMRSWVAASEPSMLTAIRAMPASLSRPIASVVTSGVGEGVIAVSSPWATACSMSS